MEQTDAQRQWTTLAQNAQAGDSVAYRILLTDLVPYIRRAIGTALPHRHAMDDVVQDVLLSIHKALPTYDPRRPFLPWIHAIIQFRKTDFLRAHYAQRDNVTTSLDDPDTPDYLLTRESDGTTKDIEDAFGTLPTQQQKVVELMKIKGYSAEEVSLKTGMSVSAVKVAAHRALQKIKSRL